MTAREAFAAIQRLGYRQSAGHVIARAARDGMIETKAARLVWGNRSLTDAVIDPAFWWAGGHAAMTSDWTVGYFETSIKRAHDVRNQWLGMDRSEVAVSAHGVMFLRSDFNVSFPLADADDDVPSLGPVYDGIEPAIAFHFALLASLRADAKQSFENEKDQITGDFLKAGRMQSGALIQRLSEVVEWVGEGAATMAAVHAATGLCSVTAFSAGNLAAAAHAVRARWPAAMMILCADDDVGNVPNKGLDAANAAARAVGGMVARPPRPPGWPDGKGWDFADTMIAPGGAEAIRRALNIKNGGA